MMILYQDSPNLPRGSRISQPPLYDTGQTPGTSYLPYINPGRKGIGMKVRGRGEKKKVGGKCNTNRSWKAIARGVKFAGKKLGFSYP